MLFFTDPSPESDPTEDGAASVQDRPKAVAVQDQPQTAVTDPDKPTKVVIVLVSASSTVNVRKRNICFDKLNTRMFGYRTFGLVYI